MQQLNHEDSLNHEAGVVLRNNLKKFEYNVKIAMVGWNVERSPSSSVYSFGFPGDTVTHFHHSLKVLKLPLVSITCFDFLGEVRNCNSQKTKKGYSNFCGSYDIGFPFFFLLFKFLMWSYSLGKGYRYITSFVFPHSKLHNIVVVH